MKIAVVGASGNLGSHLVQLLKRTHQVLSIGRNEFDSFLERIDSIDLVVHAAGGIHESLGRGPKSFVESNIMITAEILEAMKGTSCKEIVFVSSSAVYGALASPQESDETRPVTANGLSKLLCEKMLIDFCKTNEINVTVLRVFNMYGGKDTYSIIYKILDCLANGRKFTVVNDGHLTRDFIHVEDVSRVVEKVIATKPKVPILNVSTGRPVEIAGIIEKVNSLTNDSLKTIDVEAVAVDSICGNTAELQKIIDIDTFKDVLSFVEEELVRRSST